MQARSGNIFSASDFEGWASTHDLPFLSGTIKSLRATPPKLPGSDEEPLENGAGQELAAQIGRLLLRLLQPLGNSVASHPSLCMKSHSLTSFGGLMFSETAPPSVTSLTFSRFIYSPPDRKGLLDFMLESAFAMLLHHAPTQYPARAVRQWIPPSIPPELLTSGSRPVSRQSGSPVDPAQYPARAARQWIPPSIPPELASSGSPVDPAEYRARAAG